MIIRFESYNKGFADGHKAGDEGAKACIEQLTARIYCLQNDCQRLMADNMKLMTEIAELRKETE